MLKLWGRLNSINVQKAVLALEELGLPYERTDAGLQFGINRSPEYLAMNPNGLVPLLDDDGFVLWESNAIVRYLCAKYAAGTLWPEDLKIRADADRWMDWQTATLSSAMGPGFMGLVRIAPEKRDADAIAASLAKTTTLVAMLDAHLAGRDYIAGAAYSMGDIVLAPIMHRWFNMPCERAAAPHAERWYATLMQRPACARVLTLPIT
jgi:glutathione S-transferase